MRRACIIKMQYLLTASAKTHTAGLVARNAVSKIYM
jgi:hypothetical protein